MTAGTELERIPAPPADVFLRDYVRASRPVIVTGLTAGWRPPADWTPAAMAARWGAARVVAALLEGGKLKEDPGTGVVFQHVTLADFVASLAGPDAVRHYVMAPTWNFPAEFQQDWRLPDYCADAAHLRVKVWLGQAGTVTPVHRDVPHNLNVHLTGRKRWTLYPPSATRGMYSRGLLSGMPNFGSVDPEHPDWERFPRFRDATPYTATIEPGETLFLPHGWWHHTRTLEDAVGMNFWWGGRVVQLAALASSAFKRARGIRKDEWG